MGAEAALVPRWLAATLAVGIAMGLCFATGAVASPQIFGGFFEFGYGYNRLGGILKSSESASLLGGAVVNPDTDNTTVRLTGNGAGAIVENTPISISSYDGATCTPEDFTFVAMLFLGRNRRATIDGFTLFFSKTKALGLDGGNLGFGVDRSIDTSSRARSSAEVRGAFAVEVDLTSNSRRRTRDPVGKQHVGFDQNRLMRSVKVTVAENGTIPTINGGSEAAPADFILKQNTMNGTSAVVLIQVKHTAGSGQLEVALLGFSKQSADESIQLMGAEASDSKGISQYAPAFSALLGGSESSLDTSSVGGGDLVADLLSGDTAGSEEGLSTLSEQINFLSATPSIVDPFYYTLTQPFDVCSVSAAVSGSGLSRGQFFPGISASARGWDGSPSALYVDTVLWTWNATYSAAPSGISDYICWRNHRNAESNPLKTCANKSQQVPTPTFCCNRSRSRCGIRRSCKSFTCTCPCRKPLPMILSGRSRSVTGCAAAQEV